MIIKVKNDRKFYFPQFYLSGEVLNVCSVAKYLGHFCTEDLSDDKDIIDSVANCMLREIH